MALNREEQSILFKFENGGLGKLAIEYARINEQGFKHNWTVEQHEAALVAKANELQASQTPKVAPKPAAQAGTFNTGLGYYGTKKDAARGFDGIE